MYREPISGNKPAHSACSEDGSELVVKNVSARGCFASSMVFIPAEVTMLKPSVIAQYNDVMVTLNLRLGSNAWCSILRLVSLLPALLSDINCERHQPIGMP